MTNPETFAILQKIVSGEGLSAAEQAHIDEWQQSSSEKELLVKDLGNSATIINALTQIHGFEKNKDTSYKEFLSAIKPVVPVHRVHFMKTAWIRWVAVLLMTLGAGTLIYIGTSGTQKTEVAIHEPSPVFEDALPGAEKAILTLSSGQQIQLDSNAKNIIEEGELSIKNTNGELKYTASEKMVFNTMITPKGGQYKLTLADGTRVWLNAASSITFPTAFNTGRRQIEITGEAYLEIAKDKVKPFIIQTSNHKIEILGTSLNINNYKDEPAFKTTLIEGAIKIDNSVIKPGEAFEKGKVVRTNVSQDIAWKNGFFNFDNTSLAGMLRQLSRWYDIDVIYEGKIPDITLEGRVPRDLPLSQVLRLLDNLEIKYEKKAKTLFIK